jgi:predicted RNA-binding protein with TRAM domain
MSGAHHLVIGDQQKDVTVEYGEPAKVAVAQVARQGTLTIRANVDGAQVMVDGTPVGVTPLDLAITAGAHRVTVQAPGWASYERPIEVPAEGQAQITANLVHPLGYVAPPETTADPRVYLAVSGGTAFGVLSHGLGAVMFGAHRAQTDGALGYGYLYGNLAFLLEVRYQLTHGAVRPYLRLTVGLSATSSLTAALGVLIQPTHGAHRVGFFADVGGGGTHASSSGDSSWVVPVTAGLQIAY